MSQLCISEGNAQLQQIVVLFSVSEIHRISIVFLHCEIENVSLETLQFTK